MRAARAAVLRSSAEVAAVLATNLCESHPRVIRRGMPESVAFAEQLLKIVPTDLGELCPRPLVCGWP
jgi:hypothetical protein